MGTVAQTDQAGNFADILAICQRINSERDLGALLDLIAREATKLLDCDRASIFLLDRERNELWSKVALGSDEILRDDAVRMADKLRAAGCDVELEEWPRMPHVWHHYARIIPEGRDAIERIGTFVKAKLS